MMDESEPEFAIANHIGVLETNLIHANDVIYWVDGTSAEVPAEMRRIDVPLNISFSNRPRDLLVKHSVGKTALWRRPVTAMIEGEATQIQRTRPDQTPFSLAGEVWDQTHRFNPNAFDLSVGASDGQTVVVYPSPLGTQIPLGGALFGTVLINATEAPVIWGLLELEITVSAGENLTFRAQTDANGDFVLPLKRLPPLPESINEYAAQLSLTTQFSNSADSAPDLSSYSLMQLESITTTDSFDSSLTLMVIPGERVRINSASKSYLAVS